MSNIISEYLVRLGVVTDNKSVDQFNVTLKRMEHSVAKYAEGALGMALKFQTAVTTTFAAIGAAAIGMADHIANADQEYRLFALHMYMSQNAARGLKVAMDALGQPLENIAWDKELHQRFTQLLADQKVLTHEIGPNFERNMKSLRDIRFEFTRMQVAAQYLSMGLVNSVFEKMGFGSGELLNRLEQINRWIEANLPQIIEYLSSRLAPVLRDIGTVMKDTWEGIKLAALAFTNFVGLINGDKSIEGAEFSWKKFGDAITDVAHDVSIFVEHILLAEKALAHMALALEFLAERRFSDASKEFKAGVADMTTASLSVVGAGVGGVVGGIVSGGNPLGALAGAGAGAGLGFLGGQAKERYFPGDPNNPDLAGLSGLMLRGDVETAVRTAAGRYGVEERLLRAIIGVESAGNPNAVSNKGAMGLMQLVPGTASQYGARSPFDVNQNVDAGSHYLADLLARYRGNVPAAVAAYNEGQGNYDKGYMPPETADYVRKVIGAYMGAAAQTAAPQQTPNISVTVNAETNADPHQIGRAVVDAIREKSNMQNQRGAAQFSGPYAYQY